MTIIVMMPVIAMKPYGISTQGCTYTEDSLIYNNMYYELFEVNGNAGTGDFLMFSHIEVVRGSLLMVSVEGTIGSVELNAIAVIFIVDDNIILLDDNMLTVNSYDFHHPIEEYGLYGVVVFGHKLSSIAEVEMSITVVAQT
jgi:hypothetical protein